MITIERLLTDAPDFETRFARLLAFEAAQDKRIERTVRDILNDVRRRGDEAVLEYTERFDRIAAATVHELEIGRAQWAAAFATIAEDEREALQVAAERIRSFHEKQKQTDWIFTENDGTLLGQRITPIDRVGLYVPGGKAAYPSSVLMNAIPAKVAGVAELTMVVPTPDGEKNRLVLAAAHLAGVDRVFAIGGAQAIAALAYGTRTIAKVDKIVGPGNAYVACAKRLVFGIVGIDMVAGPSEILIITDGSVDPDWLAMDLFSQAEHDELAQSILIAPDEAILDAVMASIERLLPSMPRRAIIEASLEKRGALIAVRDLNEACELANRIAPEHLELSLADCETYLPLIRHAGAIFLGPFTSESLGDYCAGPNHVLPTAGSARFSSPLGVYDFQKRSSLIKVSAQGAAKLGRVAAVLAAGESLDAHCCAAKMRII